MSPTASPRELHWDGCFNVRDLGGLRTADGALVQRGALVRADALDALSEVGWRALQAHGVRTLLDLRNDDEARAADEERALVFGVERLHLPLDAIEERSFWDAWTSGWQFGTPLYWGPHLLAFPERSARVLQAIARAQPGGVVVHCSAGRDRTGMICALVLALVGVGVETIVEDYELSHVRLPPLFARRGEPDQGPRIAAFLAEHKTTPRAIIEQTLAAWDREAWRRAGGLSDEDVATLRARIVGQRAASVVPPTHRTATDPTSPGLNARHTSHRHG